MESHGQLDKLKFSKSKTGCFCGGNNTLKLLTYTIVIPIKIQIYVVKYYCNYLLCPVLDRNKLIVLQYLYWPGIRDAILFED